MNVTAIRKILKEVLWNPKTDTTMKIVSESGSKEYYVNRAIEAIRESDYVLAIRLLILVIWNQRK